jgi:hypothetical protein
MNTVGKSMTNKKHIPEQGMWCECPMCEAEWNEVALGEVSSPQIESCDYEAEKDMDVVFEPSVGNY